MFYKKQPPSCAYGNAYDLKKLIYILILTCNLQLVTLNLYPQSITWQKIYNGPGNNNDVAYDICESSDGYFYAVGAGTPIPINNGLYVLKLNPYNGDSLWTRIIPGLNAYAVAPSSDSGCVVTGLGDSVFAIKFSSSGNLVWRKHYAGNNNNVIGYDIIRDTDGNFVICGVDGSQSFDKGYLLKIDSNGNLIWQRTYPAFDDRSFVAIEVALDGGYILAGGVWEADTVKANLVKTDTAGNILWERIFRTTNTLSSGLRSISKLGNNYIAGGRVPPFFVRTDLNGNILFTKVFTEYYTYPGSDFRDMKLVGPNRFIFTFAASNTIAEDSTCHVVVTDSLGNTLLQRFFVYERFPLFEAILPLSNGDIVFAGQIKPFLSQWYDVYLARTDSLLNAPPIGIIPASNEIPNEFNLQQNYPNPFNSKSKIKFQISKSGSVKLAIFNVLGMEVDVLVNEELQPGIYETFWDAANFPSGVYFLTLYASSNIFVRKMILIK
ncbi:MAG: T9SS type A sorting domain-containing protein [Chlorobi bacterium]|nr:T9SS type A sorting domain-containing protein [Chlorobiota bacterium]MCI0714952.1 T9SS type A sorting domain-containing protein [Chlorobiota bacterium]